MVQTIRTRKRSKLQTTSGFHLKVTHNCNTSSWRGRESEDTVHFVERVLFAAVKRAPGSREQVGHTEADDDGHQRRDKLEAAHQILCVLHGALSLRRG